MGSAVGKGFLRGRTVTPERAQSHHWDVWIGIRVQGSLCLSLGQTRSCLTEGQLQETWEYSKIEATRVPGHRDPGAAPRLCCLGRREDKLRGTTPSEMPPSSQMNSCFRAESSHQLSWKPSRCSAQPGGHYSVIIISMCLISSSLVPVSDGCCDKKSPQSCR